MKATSYGHLLPEVRAEVYESLPFNIINEVRETLSHQGFYPSVKVLAESLPIPAAQTPASLNDRKRVPTKDWVEGDGGRDDEEENDNFLSDDEYEDEMDMAFEY